MASNKSGLGNVPGESGGSLAKALLGIVAVGVAGGTLLISGAKVLGEALLDKRMSDNRKLEERREADKEEVRRIMESEID